jgi:DNA-binding transcriptional LysR family regulator
VNVIYIKTFITVCESGNFTEASKKLFVPQPTVSNRIRYLEEELNQELFIKNEKGKRSVTLTIAGKKFLPYAQKIVAMFEMANEELNATETETLNIASTIPLIHPVVRKQIDLITAHDNREKVQLSFKDSDVVYTELETDQIDLAIVTRPINNPIFTCEPLGEENYDLVVSADHPLSVLDSLSDLQVLENEQVLMLDTDYTAKITKFVQNNWKYQVLTNQVDYIRQLIMENAGIALLPSTYFKREIEEEKVVRIPIDDELGFRSIQYYMAYKKHQLTFKGIDVENLLKMDLVSS